MGRCRGGSILGLSRPHRSLVSHHHDRRVDRPTSNDLADVKVVVDALKFQESEGCRRQQEETSARTNAIVVVEIAIAAVTSTVSLTTHAAQVSGILFSRIRRSVPSPSSTMKELRIHLMSWDQEATVPWPRVLKRTAGPFRPGATSLLCLADLVNDSAW